MPDAPPVIDHGYLGAIDSGQFETPWNDFQQLLATDAYREVGAVDVHAGTPLESPLELRADLRKERFHPARHGHR